MAIYAVLREGRDEEGLDQLDEALGFEDEEKDLREDLAKSAQDEETRDRLAMLGDVVTVA